MEIAAVINRQRNAAAREKERKQSWQKRRKDVKRKRLGNGSF